MILKKKHFVFLSLLYFGLNLAGFAQFEIPEKPKIQTSVYDYINLLASSQKNNLEQKLIKYSDSTSTQIVIAIINSTQGENINFLGAKWGQKWGIGKKKEDNGILVLLAKNDRKIAIHTGYGVEHLLTDALSKRIIENDIIPYFKQNNYYGGLNNGTNSIFKILNGEYKASRSPENKLPPQFIFILILIFIIFLISISKNRKNGGNRGGRYKDSSSTGSLLEAIILSNMGRGNYHRGSSSGGGWSSGSSGGFGGGFGGGGFGGGGASGGW